MIRSSRGFEAHSFDLIIASDVLHATRNLHETLDHVKQLLGSSGTILVVEATRPWLDMTLTFGLLKGWWVFDDDVRQGAPCISQEAWKSLLGGRIRRRALNRGLSDGRPVTALGDPRTRSSA